MQIAWKASPSAAYGPVLKFVFVWDSDLKLFRVCRFLWTRGKVGDGSGYSAKLSLAIGPKLFHFHREYQAWILYVLGLRIHFQKSYGGYHC